MRRPAFVVGVSVHASVHISVDGGGTGPQGDVVCLQHGLSEPRRREPRQLDLVTRRRLARDQCVGRLNPELGLGRPCGRPASQPGKLLAQQVAPTVFRRGGETFALGAGENVRGVTPVVPVDVAVLDVPDPGAYRVEEVPVVGDHDKGTAPAVEMAGEPVDGLDVEVVRGLVQDEQVVLAGEQGRERDATALTAGQGASGRFPAAGDERQVQPAQQAVQHVPHTRISGPLVLGPPRQQQLTHCSRRVERVVLGQMAEPQAPYVRDPALIGLHRPRDHGGQGRLAAAVPADDADPLTLTDAQ